jgi:uncharacterized membrane protein
VIWLWLWACGGPSTDTNPPADTDPAPPADSGDACADVSWATAGGPVLLTWCAPCHAAGLTRAQRQGAPVGVDLDTEAGALQWVDRVEAVVSGPAPTMPPAGGLDADARERLLAWVRCSR